MDPLESKFKPQQLRELPHNIEAEQSLLGSILLNNDCFEDVSDIIYPKHFFVPVNGKIYKAISTLLGQNISADPITLKDYFEKDASLQQIGGGKYLLQLVDSVVSIASVSDYANILVDLYNRRQLILIGEDIVYSASNFDLNSNSVAQIEKAESKLYELATNSTKGNCISFGEIADVAIQSIEEAFNRESKLTGVTTGFTLLNEKLGGFNKSDLIILAGRPSMGKTALSTNMAFRVAMDKLLGRAGGGNVAFFSLEMSSQQLVSRILSQESLIPSTTIRQGAIRQEDVGKIKNLKEKLRALPLFIEDTPAMSVSSIRTRARKLQRKEGLDLIIIDYLQLLQGNSDRPNESRVQEISQITRSLKGLAKELDVPVIALSQLSRAVELREDKHPQLADLRESGSIEQDADVVMFVYREEYYVERSKPHEQSPDFHKWNAKIQEVHNIAEVIIAKQRQGPIGTVQLFFDGKFTKFDNLAHERKKV